VILTPQAPEVHHKGDLLGRSYTPDVVALQTGRRLVDTVENRAPLILEPCVGGGAFARAARWCWPHARITGVDIDERATGFEDCDSGVIGDATAPYPAVLRWDLAVTNPPFGRVVTQAVTLAIVRNARAAADVCAMLMPLGYLGQQGWAPLVKDCAAIWPIVGRVWEHERELCVYVWRRHHEGPTVLDILAI
jgi:hypothetical protein